MIALVAACVLSLEKIDTELRLKAGDKWTAELSLEFKSEDQALIEVDTITYEVVAARGGIILKATYQLKENRTPEGDVVPAPPKLEPLRSAISTDGKSDIGPDNEDIVKYRIERFLMPFRPGRITEPLFFPPPANVRMIGYSRVDRPADRTGNVLISNLEESGGQFPMKGTATFTFDPVTRILMKGVYAIDNVPIPGGDVSSHLSATFVVKSAKFMPR